MNHVELNPHSERLHSLAQPQNHPFIKGTCVGTVMLIGSVAVVAAAVTVIALTCFGVGALAAFALPLCLKICVPIAVVGFILTIRSSAVVIIYTKIHYSRFQYAKGKLSIFKYQGILKTCDFWRRVCCPWTFFRKKQKAD